MAVVNMLEAKSNLSRLVQAIESGTEPEIVIARNGRPAARLVPIQKGKASRPIGVAKGKFRAPADIDAENAKIADLFLRDSE